MTNRILTCLCAVLLAAGCRDSPPQGGAIATGGVPRVEGDTTGGGNGELPPGWNFGGNECGLDGVPEGTFPLRIRLLGVENPGFSQVQLDAHLEVTIDDATEPVVESDLMVDLADPFTAWLLGQGFIPDGAGTVHVQIRFDDFGTFATGVIDARGLPIEFSAPASTLSSACHAVVSLFLGGSLVGSGQDLVLLPQLVVRYW